MQNTFSNFKELKELTKKKSSKFIKVLNLDVGGEYDSHEFLEFSKKHGIQHQFTTKYTPQ